MRLWLCGSEERLRDNERSYLPPTYFICVAYVGEALDSKKATERQWTNSTMHSTVLHTTVLERHTHVGGAWIFAFSLLSLLLLSLAADLFSRQEIYRR